jgi:peptidyl-prolyl cis-trans isomerase C
LPRLIATAQPLCHLTEMRCLLGLGVGLLAVAGCADRPSAAKAGVAEDRTEVLARVDGQTITAGDLQRRLDAMDPYARARFSAPEQKRKLLENLVRFEVLAKEAQKRGYDRDPDVQRALKDQMISALLDKELDAKVKAEDVTEAEVARHYAAHLDDFKQAEEVRVSQVFTADKAKAERAAAAARALRGKPDADKGFQELVAQLSEDEDSKSRAGDLTFFDRKTTMVPRAVVDAAFTLQHPGEVAGPVQSDRGFHVLVLTQRRPAFTRALPEVSREIRKTLVRERRTQKMEELVAEMRKRLKVEIYEDRLARVEAASGGAK